MRVGIDQHLVILITFFLDDDNEDDHHDRGNKDFDDNVCDDMKFEKHLVTIRPEEVGGHLV